MKRILFFILLFTNIGFAQRKQKPFYTIYINSPDFTIKADVLSDKKKIKTSENLIYYWYAYNKIFETHGGYDGKILNGNYSTYYLSSNLKEKGEFINGLKNNEWISWFENGKINEIVNWKKGKQEGIHKKFNKDGDLYLEERYKKDKLMGEQIIYEKGKIVSKKRFKRGVEIISKSKGKDSAEVKTKKSFKQKLKNIFKRKNKRTGKEGVNEIENQKKSSVNGNSDKTKKLKEKSNLNPQGENKEASAKKEQSKADTVKPKKKSFLEKFKSFFKRKDKSKEAEKKNK